MKNTTNGTPYTNEQWANWYNTKSSKDLFIEQEERDLETQEALQAEAEEAESTGN